MRIRVLALTANAALLLATAAAAAPARDAAELLRHAESLLRQKKASEARAAFAAVLKQDPNSADALV